MFHPPTPEFIELLADMDFSSPSSFYTLSDTTRPSSTNTGLIPTSCGRTSPRPNLPGFDMYSGSRQSLNSGCEDTSNFHQDFPLIDDTITSLSHVNSMTSNLTSTDAGSPELQYDNANTAHLFRPPPLPANILWSSGASNPLAETYGSSATMINSAYQTPDFGAQMVPLLSHQIYQHGWQQDTTSYTLEPDINGTPLDLFLGFPALSTRPANAHHPRAYSESIIPTAALMRRNQTSFSEGSVSNNEEFPNITTTTPSGHTRHRTRTNRRLTMSALTTTPNARATVRRRASTRGASRSTTTSTRQSSSAGDRSRTASGPSSPELTRSRGHQTHGTFTCPLSPYGCESVFTSKNEWKRHVLTKHLKLGYYECSLCPTDGMRAPYQNARKDLFSQHIWRMHLQSDDTGHIHQPAQRSALSTSSTTTRIHTRTGSTSSSGQVTEAVIEKYGDIYPDCYKSIRDAPQEAYCVFCGDRFRGDNSAENWLEHVGRQHLATPHPGRRGAGGNSISTAMPGYTHSEWLNDMVLQSWLIQYGEIVWDITSSGYILASGSNTNTSAPFAGEGPDAEGEPDLDVSYLS